MNWENIEVNTETEELKIPDSWLHIHYYEALNILFRFENSLRVFVYVILKNELKDDWDNTNIRNDETIKKTAGMRITQAKDYGYLCYDIKSPMLYLSSGDLINIIMNDKNWKYFKKYFKAKKEIIKHKLLEIGAVRNSLAHFRPIQKEDLNVIKQNAKHALSIIDKFLNEITSIYNIVPTNNTKDWYVRIMELTSENININLYQDKSIEWIRVQIKLKGRILNKGYQITGYKSYKVSMLSTIKLLNKYSEIKNNITYANENIVGSVNNDELEFSKNINFIISKKNLEDNYIKIIKELKSLLEIVDKEIKLLSSDNLAEGELISSVSVDCKKNQENEYWAFERSNLKDTIDNYEGSEFWGQEDSLFLSDFITNSEQYPWIPTKISKPVFNF